MRTDKKLLNRLLADISEYLQNNYTESGFDSDRAPISVGQPFPMFLQNSGEKTKEHAGLRKKGANTQARAFCQEIEKEDNLSPEIGGIGANSVDACVEVAEEVSEDFSKGLSGLMSRPCESFPEMLFRLIDERHLKDSEVYKKANISKQLFHKIRSVDGYTPKKETVFALALSLKLNKDEARDLLAKLGYTFSTFSKTDLVVEYFIDHGEYDLMLLNQVLEKFELPLLGY